MYVQITFCDQEIERLMSWLTCKNARTPPSLLLVMCLLEEI